MPTEVTPPPSNPSTPLLAAQRPVNLQKAWRYLIVEILLGMLSAAFVAIAIGAFAASLGVGLSIGIIMGASVASPPCCFFALSFRDRYHQALQQRYEALQQPSADTEQNALDVSQRELKLAKRFIILSPILGSLLSVGTLTAIVLTGGLIAGVVPISILLVPLLIALIAATALTGVEGFAFKNEAQRNLNEITRLVDLRAARRRPPQPGLAALAARQARLLDNLNLEDSSDDESPRAAGIIINSSEVGTLQGVAKAITKIGIEVDLASPEEIKDILQAYLRATKQEAAELWNDEASKMAFATELVNIKPQIPGLRGESLKAYLHDRENSILEAIELFFRATATAEQGGGVAAPPPARVVLPDAITTREATAATTESIHGADAAPAAGSRPSQ